MSSISLVYQYQLGENVNPPDLDLQSPRIIVKREEEGNLNIYATSKCQESLENCLRDGTDKPFLLQITYLLKHVHEREKVLSRDAFSLRNFKCSNGGKELVWDIRSTFIEDANSDKKSKNMERLANLFHEIFMKANVRNQESSHLLGKMGSDGFTVDEVLKHPYFWSSMKIVNFLCSIFHISKRLGSETPRALNAVLVQTFNGWRGNLQADIDDKKNYDPDSVTNILSRKRYGETWSELLRFIRNIARHYWDKNEHNAAVRDVFCSEYDGLWRFFNKKFPELLITLYHCVLQSEDLKEVLSPYLEEHALIKNIA